MVSWSQPDWFLGIHDFKAGCAYWDSHADRRSQDRGAATNMQLIYRTGVPFEAAALNYPVYPYSHVRNTPLYVQDSWTLARRPTLNLGIRFDHDWAYPPHHGRT